MHPDKKETINMYVTYFILQLTTMFRGTSEAGVTAQRAIITID